MSLCCRESGTLPWFALDASLHVRAWSCLQLACDVTWYEVLMRPTAPDSASRPRSEGQDNFLSGTRDSSTLGPQTTKLSPTTNPSAKPSTRSHSYPPPRDHVLPSRPRTLAMGAAAALPPVVRLREQRGAPRLRLAPAAEAGPAGPAPNPLHARALRVQEEQQGDEQVNNHPFPNPASRPLCRCRKAPPPAQRSPLTEVMHIGG